MEGFENNENQENDINVVDFPFICRICLKRSDSKLFEVEDYMLSLYLTITKINVRSTATLPDNICYGCIKTLEDISSFIDISMYNKAKLGKNFVPININEHVETAECETSQKHVIVNDETIEEYEEDLQYFKGFEICRICYSTNILKPVEEKAHLMQLFHNITNIDVKTEVLSYRNSICNRCIKKLEIISLFMSVSLCNEMKLKNTIGRNESGQTENCLEENAIDMGYHSEVKKDDFHKNVHSYDSKSLHTIIDIKEETVDTPEASTEKMNQNGIKSSSESHSEENSLDCGPCKNESGSGTNLKKLFISLSCNEMKSNNTIERNEVLKTENCLEGNAIDMGYRNNVKNDVEFDENAHSYDSKSLHTIIDIKEDIVVVATPEDPSEQMNYNGKKITESHSEENSLDYGPCKNKFSSGTNLKKLFISLSCNEMKSNNTIGRNETLKIENCLEGNAIDMGYRNNVKNDVEFDKNAHSYDSKSLHTVIDIKQETVGTPKASTDEMNQNGIREISESHSEEKLLDCGPCKEKYNNGTNLKELFISVSFCNEIKLKHTIGRNEALETENCLQGNAIDMGYRNKVNNDIEFDENAHSYDSKSLHTVIDIKEEIADTPKACTDQMNQIGMEEIGESHSEENSLNCVPCINEFSTGNLKNQLKGLDINLVIQSGTNRFRCNICDKSFSQKQAFKSHLFIHTGETPLKCNYDKKNNLQKHFLSDTDARTFKCDCCEKSFSRKRYLKQHMIRHNGEKPFECDYCKKCFIEKGALRRHMRIHFAEKPFKCDFCKISFIHKENLQEHMLIHNGEKPFNCDYCKKGFIQKWPFKRHMRIHTAEKSFKCDRCGKSFSQKGYLQQHMLTHIGKRQFKCDCCDKSFTQNGILQKHRLIHTGEKRFKCDYCKKRFSQNGHLQKHMRIHTGEKPFKCDYCKISFTWKASLQKHIVIHTGIKSFQCGVCEMTFALKNTLKRHVLRHTGQKPFKCDCCEKSFNQKSNLKLHMIIHTGERSFQCGRCEKTFFYKQTLTSHLLTHNKGKPFKCDRCEKRFTREWYLQQHMLIHTGEKQFKCDCCEKSFAKKNYLQSHMLIHTGKTPFPCGVCEKAFVTKRRLNLHLLTHNGEKSFKCDCCEKSFNLKGNLHQHKLIHAKEKPFKCDCCEKSFSRKTNLQLHMPVHAEERPFPCGGCEKTFATENILKQHMLYHNGEKSFECDCCEKIFSGERSLKLHLFTHTGKKPFKCECCEKCFSRKAHLQQHMLIHSGKKPFKCDCCEKSFSQKSNLQKHMLIHTGEKPFPCGDCEKSFASKSSLKLHLLSVNGEKSFKCDCCKQSFSQKQTLQQHMHIHSGEKRAKNLSLLSVA